MDRTVEEADADAASAAAAELIKAKSFTIVATRWPRIVMRLNPDLGMRDEKKRFGPGSW
jgi:hypothetical protein